MTAPINQFDAQGRLHGIWKNYWPDGTLRWRGRYLHGRWDGLWKWYHLDNSIRGYKYYYLIIK
jgi:antitoxin component YwqK of YwqJK toxin-antitoxin module